MYLAKLFSRKVFLRPRLTSQLAYRRLSM